MTIFTNKDRAFINDARGFANNHSKDRSTKVGALILDDDKTPLGWGYNGFPRNSNDNAEDRHQRPLKYIWTEHAERNAIYNAARAGHRLLGGSMYVTMAPCPDCARGIIQSGIKKLYLDKEVFDTSKDTRRAVWLETWPVSKEMLEECGVEIIIG